MEILRDAARCNGYVDNMALMAFDPFLIFLGLFLLEAFHSEWVDIVGVSRGSEKMGLLSGSLDSPLCGNAGCCATEARR
jgi:hypothetical protein